MGGFSTGVIYQTSYVVAENAEAAYRAVREHLDRNEYGFPNDRGLASVELLAEASDFAESQTRLFLPNPGNKL